MEKREKPKRKRILGHVADTFDLPGEVLGDLPRLTVTGSNRAVVENHKGIMDYGAQEILVGGGSISLKILGKDLELRSMNAQELLITGEIFHIEFIH